MCLMGHRSICTTHARPAYPCTPSALTPYTVYRTAFAVCLNALHGLHNGWLQHMFTTLLVLDPCDGKGTTLSVAGELPQLSDYSISLEPHAGLNSNHEDTSLFIGFEHI